MNNDPQPPAQPEVEPDGLDELFAVATASAEATPPAPEVPADFPDIDLAAWNAALEVPNPYPADAIARKPSQQPQAEPPPLVLSPTPARRQPHEKRPH
jgi:hypothetical protein